MKKIVFIVSTVLLIATGMFFYIRYEIRVFNAIKELSARTIYLANKQDMVESFLSQNFPDQVKAYNDALQAAQKEQPK